MKDYSCDPFGYRYNSNFENAEFHWQPALYVYFSISLRLGHKGFHRKLHLITLLFNLYLYSNLNEIYTFKILWKLGEFILIHEKVHSFALHV